MEAQTDSTSFQFQTPGTARTKTDSQIVYGVGYKAQRPKDGVAAPGQILDVKFLGRFPSTPDEFGPETSAIRSVLKLSFHPYKEHLNLNQYATWASVLVRAIPRVRN